VDDGYARLPGAGYAALHPELKDVNPEDYPDINKMAILADVAPYSRAYNTARQQVLSQSQGDTALRIRMDDQVPRPCRQQESSRARGGAIRRRLCHPLPEPASNGVS
jgi:hypothetical protein